MNNEVNLTPSYYRFTRKTKPRCVPKYASIFTEPVIKREERFGGFVAPDTLRGFNLRLEHFDCPPVNGVFDFWTKHWVGDTQDSEWPWMQWTFQNVEWGNHGDLYLGWCEIKIDEKPKKTVSPLTLRKQTGFMYVKKVPGK